MRTHLMFALATLMTVSLAAAAGSPGLTKDINRAISAIKEFNAEQQDYSAVLQAKAPNTSPAKAYVRLLLASKNGPELAGALALLQKEDPETHAWAVVHSIDRCKPVCSLDQALATLLARYPNNAHLHLLRGTSASGPYTFEEGKGILHYENTLSPAEVATLRKHLPGLVEDYTDGGLKPERIQSLLAIGVLSYPYPEKCLVKVNGKNAARPECSSAALAIISNSQSREPVMYALSLQRSLCRRASCPADINKLVVQRREQVRTHYRMGGLEMVNQTTRELNALTKDHLAFDLM